MRNGYCVGYHEAVWNVLGTSGTLFARSGFSGTQKFPFGWAGDNAPNFSQENGLRSVMTAGLSAAMSGFSMWAHDVGGYEDSKYEKDPEELFIRWSQFGALSPVMQMHRQVGTGRQYAWSYGARALENYRACARLHSQLFPYIYKCAERASRTGLPILQPLVLRHQDDARLAAVQDEYYFGDDLLVAPIADAGATSRTVVLPPGRWVNWWTREKVDGGRDVVWSGDVTRFPLYVRDGAVVPMLQDVPMSLCGEDYVAGAGAAAASNGGNTARATVKPPKAKGRN
jgi:alpha-D-xyloside xylohydrolase